jgi:asparagine synthase (glutamine-hydrolysing)
MCGIFGILQHRPQTTPALDRLELTARLLEHRGPDHRAVFADDGIGLAQTRLALVDLTPRSNQPFWDASDRYGLVYNGEIYNFRELRAELEAGGRTFRTTSDTEVLLEALLHLGADKTLPRLEGMFAFALYDTRERSLLLARDRFGIKPLYVYDEEDAFVFSSEIPAMRPWVPFEPDTFSISAYLQGFGGPSSGVSFYKNVRFVPPGTVLTVRRGGRGQSRMFWRMEDFWDPNESERLQASKPGQIVDEVEARLTESVRMQLLADAPVGVLASGGVDSSLVTAIAARHHGNLAVFHANVVGPNSEHSAASALARHLKLDLKVVPVVDADTLETLPEVILHFGHPFTYHSGCVPFLMVSKLVRTHGVKGILSGEGSDESYIGYPWLIFDVKAYLRQAPKRLPEAGYRVLRDTVKRALGRPVFRKSGAPLEVVRGLHSRFEIDVEHERIRAALKQRMGRAPTVPELVSLFQLGYNLRMLMHRNDSLGMAASVEARFPFLDTRLIRLAVNMPFAVKVRPSASTLVPTHLFLRDKWVLRKVADRYLPPSLAQREKAPFGFRGNALMRIAPEYFDNSYVADLFQLGAQEVRHMASHASQELRVRLLHLDAWGRVCLQGGAAEDVKIRLRQHVTYR